MCIFALVLLIPVQILSRLIIDEALSQEFCIRSLSVVLSLAKLQLFCLSVVFHVLEQNLVICTVTIFVLSNFRVLEVGTILMF